MLALCVWLLFGAFVEDHSRREFLERLGIGLLCGAYALAQLVLSTQRRLRWWTACAFYVLCPALAVLAGFTLGGYAKGWAPHTFEEGRAANFEYFGMLALLAIVCALTFVAPRTTRSSGDSA